MQYVAFLRAINVGGRTVKMERLREIFESMKLGDVRTFIASGNVLFSSAAKAASLEERIEKKLEVELGYEVATFLREAGDVRRVAESATVEEGCNLYVGFLKEAPSAESAAKVRSLSDGVDEFDLEGRELYWTSRKSLGVSKISGATLERALKGPVTLRNITSVRKLAATLKLSQ
jgi:uncharacterized protein (DUF1697 family)